MNKELINIWKAKKNEYENYLSKESFSLQNVLLKIKKQITVRYFAPFLARNVVKNVYDFWNIVTPINDTGVIAAYNFKERKMFIVRTDNIHQSIMDYLINAFYKKGETRFEKKLLSGKWKQVIWFIFERNNTEMFSYWSSFFAGFRYMKSDNHNGTNWIDIFKSTKFKYGYN